jgi:hypothetical protein
VEGQNSITFDSKTFDRQNEYAYQAILAYSGGFQITSEGGSYSASFTVKNNEAIWANILVENKKLYTVTAIDQAAEDAKTAEEVEALLKSAIGFTPNANYDISAVDTISLPTTANLYYKGDETTTEVGVYWTMVKYYTKNTAVTKSTYTYDDYDFKGTIQGTRDLLYNIESIKEKRTNSYPTSAPSVTTLSQEVGCTYVLTAYIGRVYDGEDLKLVHQYALEYTITIGNYDNVGITSNFFGAWRSADISYEYLVFDLTNTGAMRFIGATTTEGNVDDYDVNDDGKTLTYTLGAETYTAVITDIGLTVTQQSDSSVRYYVRYEL